MPHILISICFPVRKLNSLAADHPFTNHPSDGLCVQHIHLAFHLSKLEWPLQAPLSGHQCFSNTGSVFTFRQLTMKFIWLQGNLAFLRGSGVNCCRKKKIRGRKSLSWLMIWFTTITENYPDCSNCGLWASARLNARLRLAQGGNHITDFAK